MQAHIAPLHQSSERSGARQAVAASESSEPAQHIAVVFALMLRAAVRLSHDVTYSPGGFDVRVLDPDTMVAGEVIELRAGVDSSSFDFGEPVLDDRPLDNPPQDFPCPGECPGLA